MKNWKNTLVSPETPLRDTIARIDASSSQVALVLDDIGHLAGIVTDGDIRRAILRGQDLSVPTSEVMNRKPSTALVSTTREQLLDQMRRDVFHHMPLVDDEGKVVGLATLDELVGAIERPNSVIIMAGGLGSRLHPLTEDCPKPMLLVGGKPILETILESFIEQGFRRFYLSVNYKADIIRGHFGDGNHWGAQVEYLHETSRLGTAGALSLLPKIPQDPIIIMNGDLLTRASIDGLLEFHTQNNATATMAVREYDFQVPYGVVQLEGLKIRGIEEKPVQSFFVNAGIYALSPAALKHVPDNVYFDMPTLFEKLIASGETTSAYPLREYWIDIGRMEELERAQQEWMGGVRSND